METKKQIDPPLLSAISAFIGALMGGGPSLVAAVYTQRRQDRLQRIAREITKRETVYADFIMTASRVLLSAYVSDGLKLDGDGQHLIGLANRMRLFAPPTIIDKVEAVIKEIVKLSHRPGKDVTESGSSSPHCEIWRWVAWIAPKLASPGWYPARATHGP
jgi:hypothetical protein